MNNEVLVNEFIRFLSLHDIHEKRQKKYICLLGRTSQLLDKDFDKADKKDIEEIIKAIDDKKKSDGKTSYYSGWSKHDYRVCIKKFYTWYYNKDNDDLDTWDTPSIVRWIKIKVPKSSKKLPSELITPSDIRMLVENSRSLREKAIILTLYESGARIGELLDLKIKDVIFDDYGCILNLFGKTGYRKVRLVGSAPAISEWINLEHPKRNDKESYLFCNTYNDIGGKLTYESLVKVLKNLKKRTGFIKNINPHLFRHSRATELSEFLTDAQRYNFFGWEQGSKVCRVYTHLQDTDRIILELNGLVEKQKDKDGKFKNIICPRCRHSNPYGSEICNKCSLGLDIKSIEKYEKRDQYVKEFLDPKKLDDLINDAVANKVLEFMKQQEKQNIIKK